MKTGRMLSLPAFLLLSFIWLNPARAGVLDSSAVGFTVKNVVPVSGTPEDIYRHIVKDVGLWWNSAHTFSKNSKNLSIDDNANACFCEKLENGGNVRHLDVIYAQPGKVLRMRGALGPLQSMAVTGSMTWSLAKTDSGTSVEVIYTVCGYRPGGMQSWASPVDGVLREQMLRLKSFCETGKPEPAVPGGK